MSNLGWLFYKDYYKDLKKEDYILMLLSKEEKKDKEKEIKILENRINSKVRNLIDTSANINKVEPLGNIYFQATTTYPGLLIGSGYLHEITDIKGQAILGFDFDYTTGLPIIRGSSIKGVLRSAFEHPEYIKELLNKDDIDIKALEEEIFDNGDVFFDAVIVKADSFNKILGDDYLAPHGEDPLKNPIPLRFIKILPNVTFRFDFELKDGLINKEEKVILFSNILSDFGIGAKTNVGYGKFEENIVQKVKKQLQDIETKRKEEEKRKKEQEEKQKKQQELDNMKSNIEKIKYEIKDKTKNNTKDIYEIIGKYELNEKEKKELKNIIQDKIGPKPKPKNKAAIKWAIRIYEFLGY